MVLGFICLAAFLVACYFVGSAMHRWRNLRSASLLSALAPMVNGAVDRRNGWLDGTCQGRKLRVTVGGEGVNNNSENCYSLKALKIEIMDLPGRGSWDVRFEATGLGFGPNKLKLMAARAPELEARLKASSILEEVGRVSAATQTYVTVTYGHAQKKLTYTDDISPRHVPTKEQFARQLALAVRLADLNESLNT